MTGENVLGLVLGKSVDIDHETDFQDAVNAIEDHARAYNRGNLGWIWNAAKRVRGENGAPLYTNNDVNIANEIAAIVSDLHPSHDLRQVAEKDSEACLTVLPFVREKIIGRSLLRSASEELCGKKVLLEESIRDIGLRTKK